MEMSSSSISRALFSIFGLVFIADVAFAFVGSVDNTPPTLSTFERLTPATSPTNADTLIFKVTFDEDVMNVDTTDFAVDGTTTATVTNVATVSAAEYSVTVSGGDLMSFDGNVGLNLAGGQNIADLAGNALPAGEPATDEVYVVDNTAPTFSSIVRSNPATSPTNADTLVFRATFDEDVVNVGTGDFAVNGTTTATVTNVATVSASVYDVTVSGGDLSGLDDTVGLNLGGSQDITDLAGHALPAGEPATDETYLVDNTAPTFSSIERLTPATSPTNADTLIFRATFDEDVTNVGTGDFGVDGTTTATVTNVSMSSASEYDVTVSGGDLSGFNGDVGLNLGGSQDIADLAGNPLPAGEPATDEKYTVDNIAPTVAIGAPSVASTAFGPVSFGITYTGATGSINLTTGDVSLNTTGTAAASIGVTNGTTATPTVTISSVTGTGTIGISIAAGTSSDAAGNLDAGAGPSDTFSISRTSLQQWRLDEFGIADILDPAKEATVWGFTANPDRDFRLNGFEFLHGSDPNVFDASPAVTESLNGKKTVYSFKKRDDLSGTTAFSVEVAGSPGGPFTPLSETSSSPTVGEPGFSDVTYEDTVDVATGTPRFGKLLFTE